MTIGIASPISSKSFLPFLDDISKIKADKLSNVDAPAVTTLAKEFLCLGHKLVIFTLDSNTSDITVLTGPALTIYVGPLKHHPRFQFIYMIWGQIRMICKLFRLNPEPMDVLSVHWTRDYALAAKKMAKCPIFVTIRDIIPYIIKQYHGFAKFTWGSIFIKNEIVMHSKSFHFIANSAYTASMVKSYWELDIPVINNPILEEYVKIPLRPYNSRQALSIATISLSAPDDKRKNVFILISAFKEFHLANPSSILYLIGPKFTEDNSVIQEWKAKGYLNGVILKGKMSHSDVIDLLQSVSLLVHPSIEETFGNTLIEAMACGCPVLGGVYSGAVPYVLDHGNAGYLCDMNDKESIIRAMKHILLSGEGVEEKIAYAKKFCKTNFSSVKIAQEYINLFSKYQKTSC